jgi:hypothetical protein
VNNVITFPQKSPTQASPILAKDKGYFVADVQFAISVAAYLYGDFEAADRLTVEMQKMYKAGRPCARLSADVRSRCGEYLRSDEETIRKTLVCLYSNIQSESREPLP